MSHARAHTLTLCAALTLSLGVSASQNTSFGGCNAWTWHDTTQGSYALDCYFRYDGVWDPKSAPGHVSGKVVPIYVADLTGQV